MYCEILNKNNYGIDWINSVGSIVKFIYDDIQGEIKIVSYNKNKLGIQYLNNDVFYIRKDHFTECQIGKYLGKHTNEFKIEIGTRFVDGKRDITIVNRKYVQEENINKQGRKSIENKKYYQYRCNKCGFECGEHYKNGEYREELWITEGDLKNKIGCACCHSLATVPEINSIVANPETMWMVKYFQGGYDEAKKYSNGSPHKLYFKCPDCGRIKNKKISINGLKTRKTIGCSCGDGKSYPEKFMFNILEQLEVDFITELANNEFKWCDKYRYDFYIPSINGIIETFGLQHYQVKSNNSKFGKELKEEQENDKIKEKIAKDNKIDQYIIVDCKESDLDYIKNNILNSKLLELFDLSKIDWLKCEEFALSNLVKKACELKRDNPDFTTSEISKIMNLSGATIRRYLKRGTKLGWCNYDTKDEMKKIGKKNGKSYGKKVEIFKNNILLGIFENCAELERQSEELFDVKLNRNKIYDIISKRKNTYYGFSFKYV